jgi:two-component system, NtrC family, nitrogen regulation sensor histidine kinase NtrY
MTLRTKLILLIASLHLLLGAAAGYVLLERPVLLFAMELVFLISIAVSIRLVESFFVPLELIRTGSELISERDFSMRFVRSGQPEMDALVDVYNSMIDRLREERLAGEEGHQLLQKLIDASPAGVVICDFDGRPESMNPAAQRFVTPELLARLTGIGIGESKLVPIEGPRRLRVSRAEFRDRGFSKSFYLVEEMTDELRVTERAAYEKLIRMMSHEVNNSVGAVRSLLESALRYAPQIGEADRDDYTQALTIASGRVDALNRFMSGFADVVRIPAPRKTATRVADLVSRMGTLLRPELESRRIAMPMQLDDVREFDVDSSQIEQVILNVLKNAIDAVGREGSVIVTLRNGTLTVDDSGPGIAADALPELFTPFFTTKRDGRGLGLTIVQEILSNHGLSYSLSNRPGGGASFTIHFDR